jgi:uncharacterized membrane protein
MRELIVMAFDDPTGAEKVRSVLIEMQKQYVVSIEDAAVVVRTLDGRIKVKQAVDLVGAGLLGGAFWGMLIGLLFWMPWMGMAVGALGGALSGATSDFGVDDAFIKRVGAQIQPGHSALFLLLNKAVFEKLVEPLRAYHPTILQTSLSPEQEDKLKHALGAGD